ncbi:MAG: hypothetical protein LBV42_00370 [Methanobrevibacter sp.]|jgi:type III restriction enzyme|nr:hypothetical protein [Methanobrevibacter sp.]
MIFQKRSYSDIEDEIYIIERKGLEDLSVPAKLTKLNQWCEDINSLQNDVKFNWLYIKQDLFRKYTHKNFKELIESFKNEGEDLIL